MKVFILKNDVLPIINCLSKTIDKTQLNHFYVKEESECIYIYSQNDIIQQKWLLPVTDYSNQSGIKSFFVPAESFSNIIKQFPENEINIEYNEQTNSLQFTGVTTSIKVQIPISIENKENVFVPFNFNSNNSTLVTCVTDAINNAIKMTSFAISKINENPLQSSMLLTINDENIIGNNNTEDSFYVTAYGTDLYKYAIYNSQINKQNNNIRVLLPINACKVLPDLLNLYTIINIETDNKYIKFYNDVCEFISKLNLEENKVFPPYSRIKELPVKLTAQINKNELMQYIKLIGLNANEDFDVLATFNKKGLILKANNDNIIVDSALNYISYNNKDKDEIVINWLYKHFVKGIEIFPNNIINIEIKYFSINNIIRYVTLFKTENFIFVIMPIELKQK